MLYSIPSIFKHFACKKVFLCGNDPVFGPCTVLKIDILQYTFLRSIFWLKWKNTINTSLKGGKGEVNTFGIRVLGHIGIH